jgi:hypothetical protein
MALHARRFRAPDTHQIPGKKRQRTRRALAIAREFRNQHAVFRDSPMEQKRQAGDDKQYRRKLIRARRHSPP